MANTASKLLTVYTRGADLDAVTEGLKTSWRLLYSFSLCQVWTWRGGEAIVACDHAGNYGRGEYRVVVRTGGLQRGAVRVLYATCFKDAMDQLGIRFRTATGMRPRAPRSSTAKRLHVIARAARRAGKMFRMLHARPAPIAHAAFAA